MFLRKLCTAAVASSFVATSAAAVTVSINTKVEAVFNGPLTGSGLAIGDSVVMQFDIDETQTLIGTDPTGGNLAPDVGIPSISKFTQKPNSYVVTRPYGDIDSVEGAYAAYTNASVTIPRLGQTYDYGSGFLRATVWDIDANFIPVGSPEFDLELEFSTDFFSGKMSWRSATPLSLDPSSYFGNLSANPDSFEGGFKADAVVLGVVAYSGNQYPGLATVATYGGSVQVSSSATPGTKPLPPMTAVPVPAPFLMLGMALAGLFSLGRRSRA